MPLAEPPPGAALSQRSEVAQGLLGGDGLERVALIARGNTDGVAEGQTLLEVLGEVEVGVPPAGVLVGAVRHGSRNHAASGQDIVLCAAVFGGVFPEGPVAEYAAEKVRHGGERIEEMGGRRMESAERDGRPGRAGKLGASERLVYRPQGWQCGCALSSVKEMPVVSVWVGGQWSVDSGEVGVSAGRDPVPSARPPACYSARTA